jgi:hypothetical protein
MSARVPLDVDLEDRLLYGLTPVHLAYVVAALLAGFALWSSHWAPAPVRAMACLLVIGVGAVVAWGNWRGRSADAWMADAVLFSLRSHRLVWNESFLRLFEHLGARRSQEPEVQEAAPDTEAVAAAA